MELFFTPLHVLCATVAGFLVGSVWFSPVLFMKAWLKGEGVSKDQMPKRTTAYMVQINTYSFIAHAAIASVLAVMFDILTIRSLSLAIIIASLLTFGFVVTTQFISMVYTPKGKHYEMQSQIKFLVNAGYYLVVVAVMSSVLFLMTHR
jgi:hypothetical protein